MKQITVFIFCLILFFSVTAYATLRGTGDLGIIIERASGSISLVETTHNTVLSRISGLGDLSHASAVFSRDARYAFIFGRDGGLTKIDLLENKISGRIIQSGNSIGGAISQDGKLVAVSNYDPGGIKVFNANSLELVANIKAEYEGAESASKVVGLVDAPGNRFVFSLFDAGEIWIADFSNQDDPEIMRFKNAGLQPYDGLITPNGRYYVAGLFGESGLALIDLWNTNKGVQKILTAYEKNDDKLPVYKMPHLEGWAVAGDYLFVPAIGHHEVIVIDRHSWEIIKRIPVIGQPVFTMARPDGRYIWVNFSLPNNDTLQIIDTTTLEVIHSLKPGKAVLHMEFTPRGETVWVSVRDDNKVKVYNTENFKVITDLDINKPSGIFFTSRAHKIGL